jgi:hypothetical protein
MKLHLYPIPFLIIILLLSPSQAAIPTLNQGVEYTGTCTVQFCMYKIDVNWSTTHSLLIEISFTLFSASDKSRYFTQLSHQIHPSYTLSGNQIYVSANAYNPEAYLIRQNEYSVSLDGLHGGGFGSVYIQVIDIGPYLYTGYDYSNFQYKIKGTAQHGTLTNYCPFGCHSNGTCVKNSCVCDSGHIGSECQESAVELTGDWKGQMNFDTAINYDYKFWKIKKTEFESVES